MANGRRCSADLGPQHGRAAPQRGGARRQRGRRNDRAHGSTICSNRATRSAGVRGWHGPRADFCQPEAVHHVDLGLLVLRLGIGLTVCLHGFNKVFGGGKLAGTGGWFASMGMKPGWLHARMAAATEIGAGLLLAVGLLTPLAAAGIIAVMLVAGVTAHRKNGFFIFRPGQGWEYVMVLAVAAFAVGAIGAGAWSIDARPRLGRRRLVGRDRGRRRRPRRRGPLPGRLLPARAGQGERHERPVHDGRRPVAAADAAAAARAAQAGHGRDRRRRGRARGDVDLRLVLRPGRQHRSLRRRGVAGPGRAASARRRARRCWRCPTRVLVQGRPAQVGGAPATGRRRSTRSRRS